MATLPSLFDEFLNNIRPSDEQRENYVAGHSTLRDRLQNDDSVAAFYVWDFLQGSYRRYTAVKPIGNAKSDVDVAFVTSLDKDEYEPAEAMEQCEPFLDEHYAGKWSRNDRSYKIEEDQVEIDLVLTAAPSEAAEEAIAALSAIEVGEALNADQSHKVAKALGSSPARSRSGWRDDPLDIPDRRLEQWEVTHPLATIDFTLNKNDFTDGYYVNVVKAIKWWRRTQTPNVDGPTSYPLEHMVGTCCPNTIDSVAEGVTRTFEEIVDRFAVEAAQNETPELPAHQLPNTNVLDRIEGQDFAAFYAEVVTAADSARRALDEEDKATARDHWYELFGDEFPPFGGDDDSEDGKEMAPSLGSSSEATGASSHQFG